MDIAGFIVVYLCSWWLAFLAVMPLWVERDQSGDKVVAPGAPQFPHLKRKFVLASIIAAVITLVIYVLIQMNVINFWDIAGEMAAQDYGS